MRRGLCNKIIKYVLLFILLWIVATLLIWTLITIFGYGNDVSGVWDGYTWGDFCFDGIAMGVLIAISMLLNAIFIHVFNPLQDYRGRAFLYSVLLLAMNVLASLFIMTTTEWIWGEMPHNEFVNCTYMYCLVATFVSSIHANISFQRMFQREQQEKHELELKAARQEEIALQTSLLALKTQIDPHFLFNNFSILSDLIDESPVDARHFLDSLSRVYRFKLINMNANLVDVDAEISMVRSYVHLLQEHYGATLQVKFPDTPVIERLNGLSLPPLSLQMAVENAVKHNARTSANPLVVTISVLNSAIVVSNPIYPLSSIVSSTGMGIKNLKARYALLSTIAPKVENDGKTFTIYLPLIREKQG